MRTEIRNIALAAILAVTPAGLNQQDKSTGSEFNTYLPIIVNVSLTRRLFNLLLCVAQDTKLVNMA